MKPVIILDKSVFEGLSHNEVTWLDQFFNTNIIPPLVVEILGNLAKDPPKYFDSSEHAVNSLMHKLPRQNQKYNVSHFELIKYELFGEINIDIESTEPYTAKNHKKFNNLEEEINLLKNNTFSKEIYTEAELHRNFLRDEDLEKVYESYRKKLADIKGEITFEVLKKLIHKSIDAEDQEKVLQIGMSNPFIVQFSTPLGQQQQIIDRWKEEGSCLIRKFAPYFIYVMSIHFLSCFGVGANLITRQSSNIPDISYLFYLPFCMIFSSSDKLHKSLFPLFSHQNQIFVSGEDLKKDLKKLYDQYKATPNEIKHQNINFPPEDTSFLTTRLWDRYVPNWREEKRKEFKIYTDCMNKKKIFIWIVVILLVVFSANMHYVYQGRYCYDNYFRNMYHFYRYDAFRAEPNYDVSCPGEFVRYLF